MSVATLERPCAFDSTHVLSALSALRSNSEEVSLLLDDVFDDLESLGNAADVKSQLLEESRRHIAEQTAELSAVRHAEALAAAELSTMRGQIDQAQERLVSLPKQNEELKEHLHALELERCGLEAELEALRVRTAELADHLAEVKRESAEERAEWSSELKQLRRTLERQSELLADRLSAAIAVDRGHATATAVATKAEPETGTKPAAAVATAKDAVLGSVIAQFEMLQKDRQRRRQ
jgi:chromosome segregation ATPase